MRFSRPEQRVDFQLEVGFHRFSVLSQACIAVPDGGCYPESPPKDLGFARGAWLWPSSREGPYATAGAGAYGPSVRQPRFPSTALGVDLGAGFRWAWRRSSLLLELRVVRLLGRDFGASMVPISVGLLF
jgi:hypothetical protein